MNNQRPRKRPAKKPRAYKKLSVHNNVAAFHEIKDTRLTSQERLQDLSIVHWQQPIDEALDLHLHGRLKFTTAASRILAPDSWANWSGSYCKAMLKLVPLVSATAANELLTMQLAAKGVRLSSLMPMTHIVWAAVLEAQERLGVKKSERKSRVQTTRKGRKFEHGKAVYARSLEKRVERLEIAEKNKSMAQERRREKESKRKRRAELERRSEMTEHDKVLLTNSEEELEESKAPEKEHEFVRRAKMNGTSMSFERDQALLAELKNQLDELKGKTPDEEEDLMSPLLEALRAEPLQAEPSQTEQGKRGSRGGKVGKSGRKQSRLGGVAK